MTRKTQVTSTKPVKSAKRNPPKPAPEPAARAIRSTSKIGKLIALLRQAEGATLTELMKATGWQAHSVRGAIAGTLKKKHGLTIASERREEGTRVYRIVP